MRGRVSERAAAKGAQDEAIVLVFSRNAQYGADFLPRRFDQRRGNPLLSIRLDLFQRHVKRKVAHANHGYR
jgi:hypothetical protein